MSAATKQVFVVFLGAMLLAAPACLQSTSDPGSELNPQPLPPQDPEKNGAPTTSPGGDQTGLGGGSSSSGSSSSGGTATPDAGSPDADAGQGD